jgi:DNA polymerase III subunit epsilon
MQNNQQIEDNEKIYELESTGNYRVLKKLQPPKHYNHPDGTDTKLAIYLDLETTGLDYKENEIIEIGLIPFEYSVDGRIFKVHDSFNQFQEPAEPIPDEITKITGITNNMVSGHEIDKESVTEIIVSASIIIAHNANFDRKFAEKFLNIFADKPWACSMTQIGWAEEGFDSLKLEYLGMKSGFFYEAHRASNDCYAGIELLGLELPKSRKLALNVLLETARQSTFRVWAEGAPFDLKDLLKQRGYRWNDGNDGQPKSWYKDITEESLDRELLYLKSEIFQKDIDIQKVKFDAFDRFSSRI